MKTITHIIYPIFVVLSLACPALAQQAPDSVSIRVITTFDYPGAFSTIGSKINDAGDIVGSYSDSNGVTRGFVRFANGNFSPPLVDPNDTCNNTIGFGINNSRLVCGSYASGADCTTAHGYFLMHHNFSDFDVPGSLSTEVLGVNNVGDFAGSFTDSGGNFLAFLSLGGTITSFSVPGALATVALQLNSSNQTVGYYIDSITQHGYYRDADGTLHFPIDPSGSTQTALYGNNDSNWMVGKYLDGVGTRHGLFFVPPNRFFSFDYPGSTSTSFQGINAQGFICGYYLDASFISHGILARVRVSASANEADTEMKGYDSPSLVTPLDPLSLARPVNPSPSAW